MSIYQLPEIKNKMLKSGNPQNLISEKKIPSLPLFFILVFLIGLIGGIGSSYVFYLKLKQEVASAGVPIIQQEKVIEKEYIPQTTQEQKIIDVVKQNSPSVVSIVISQEVPVYSYSSDPFGFFYQKKQTGTEKQEVGSGTGFIVSEDGMVVTNKHVAYDDKAEYKAIMADGKEYSAKILAKDPVQDLAIMQIESSDKFKPLVLGNADDIQVGQTVIAIGNALGEFENTVSVGVISGLGRTVVASGGTFGSETLEDIIQTDAAINHGNSGGPLLNLKGEVIGINTAIASTGQSIGFAISIDKAKKDVEQVKSLGKISYPFVGVRYVLVDENVVKEKNLSVNYGALVIRGSNGEPAISSGSPAETAGIQENDIILEMGGEKITKNNSLSKIIAKYDPKQAVDLKILRNGEEISKTLVLGEWKQ